MNEEAEEGDGWGKTGIPEPDVGTNIGVATPRSPPLVGGINPMTASESIVMGIRPVRRSTVRIRLAPSVVLITSMPLLRGIFDVRSLGESTVLTQTAALCP